MISVIWLIAGGVFAYLMGSFSSAVWIGRWFYGIDVRKHGSGNAGATNTFRVLGNKAGVIVMIIDIAKAWFAVMLASVFAGGSLTPEQIVNYKILLGSLAVIGHVYPVFTGFRGGKGVASLVGVIIALYSPYIFLIVLCWFVFVFLITRYVSVASMTSAVLFSILALFVFPQTNLFLIILAALIAVFIPFTHRDNIKRLLKGQENKFRFKTKEK